MFFILILLETIGDRPLVQFTLSLGGIQSKWNNPQAPVKVSIPYTPTAEELSDPEHIVVWYIDGEGNVISVPNGRYDLETGRVIEAGLIIGNKNRIYPLANTTRAETAVLMYRIYNME